MISEFPFFFCFWKMFVLKQSETFKNRNICFIQGTNEKHFETFERQEAVFGKQKEHGSVF